MPYYIKESMRFVGSEYLLADFLQDFESYVWLLTVLILMFYVII